MIADMYVYVDVRRVGNIESSSVELAVFRIAFLDDLFALDEACSAILAVGIVLASSCSTVRTFRIIFDECPFDLLLDLGREA